MSYLTDKLISQKIREMLDQIEECKEEILTAFVAKYGYQPDEVEIVFKNTFLESTWHVRKRE